MVGVEGGEFQRLRGLALHDLGHDLAVVEADHHAVALADGGRGREDDDVTLAVDRLHRITGDLEGIGIGVGDARNLDLVPAIARGEARIIEEAALARLGEAKQRDLAQLRRLATAADQQFGEFLHRGARGLQQARDRLHGGPARAAIGAVALRGIERGRVEARLLGEARGREAIALGDGVDRVPDLLVREHDALRLGVKVLICRKLYLVWRRLSRRNGRPMVRAHANPL